MRAKYNQHRIDRLIDLIKNQDLSINDMCARVGIATSTYYNWKKKNYFNNVVNQANLVISEQGLAVPRKTLKMAVRGLKKLNGY